MKKLIFTLVLLLSPLFSFAGTTTVSGVIQDPNGQVFAGGTCQFQFQPTPGVPGPYTSGGVPFSTQPTCTLDGSGNIFGIVTDNLTIDPAGSKWMVTVCPNASVPCSSVALNITGVSDDVGVVVSAVIPTIKLPPLVATPRAYQDSQVTPINQGSSYWNTTNNNLKMWNGSAWVSFPNTAAINNWTADQQFTIATIPGINAKTNSSIGFVADNTTDNSSKVSLLMSVINNTPTVGGSQGPRVYIPPTSTTGGASSYYYFSQAFRISRTAPFDCAATGGRRDQVILLFSDAAEAGIVFESNTTSSDGGISISASLNGCALYSYAMRTGTVVNGDTKISAATTPTYGTKQGDAWAANDGVIAITSRATTANTTALPSGTFISSVSGSTNAQVLNLAGGATITGVTGSVTLWRLPASLGSNVTTLLGNGTVTVTGGTVNWEVGDICWTDAFPFPDCVIKSVSGSVGAQTLTIYGRYAVSAQTATVTHAAGSGLLFKVPSALQFHNSAFMWNNYTKGFPVGVNMLCGSGMSPSINCTEMGLYLNFHESHIVGRWNGGNNAGGSTFISNVFTHNFFADEYNNGTLGESITGDAFNSSGNDSKFPVQGSCTHQNTSGYYSAYIESGADATWVYCADGAGTSVPFFIQPLGSTPPDVLTLKGSNLTGSLIADNGVLRTYFGTTSTSLTNTAFAFSQTGGTQVYRLQYTICGTGIWGFVYQNSAGGCNLGLADSSYTGTHTSSTGTLLFPQGFVLGSNSGSNTRFYIQSTAAPVSGNWDTGDWVFKQAPTSTGQSTLFSWVNTAGGAPGTFTTLYALNTPMQAKRGVSGCTTGALAGNTCGAAITVSWPNSFADTNYSATCTGMTPTNVPSAPFIVAKNTGNITVNYFAITAAAASYATVDCIAIHD